MADSKRVFAVGGELVEYPTVDTFNMDEAEEFYRVAGIAIEELLLPHPDLSSDAASEEIRELLRKMQAPSFLRGLMNVGYLRAHPDANRAAVDAAVGSVNIIDALAGYWAEDDDAVPLAPTNEPARSSLSETDGSNMPSGRSSAEGSGRQDGRQGSTGHTRSDTSPTLAPARLVV